MIIPVQKQHSSGQLIPVSFIDGRPGEQIFVKLLPSRFYPDLRRAIADEARQAEIFTGRDATYIDSLHPQSVEGIVVAGWRINREHVSNNLARILEQAAEQSQQILDVTGGWQKELRELVPEMIENYKKAAKSNLKSALPEMPSEAINPQQLNN